MIDSDLAGCSWVNNAVDSSASSTYIGRWALVLAGKYPNDPKVDGSKNKTGHFLHMASASSTQNYVFRGLVRNSYSYTPTLKQSYYACKMNFQYFMLGSNSTKRSTLPSLMVYTGNFYEGGEMRFRVRANTTDWVNATVYIGSYVEGFKVRFDGTMFVNDTLALDNIEFVDCGIPQPLKPGSKCAGGEVMCKNTGFCIKESDLCDFQDDCGDNWDEGYDACASEMNNTALVPSCDFEESIDYCGFTRDPLLEDAHHFSSNYRRGFGWELDNGYKYFASDPPSDHTT